MKRLLWNLSFVLLLLCDITAMAQSLPETATIENAIVSLAARPSNWSSDCYAGGVSYWQKDTVSYQITGSHGYEYQVKIRFHLQVGGSGYYYGISDVGVAGIDRASSSSTFQASPNSGGNYYANLLYSELSINEPLDAAWWWNDNDNQYCGEYHEYVSPTDIYFNLRAGDRMCLGYDTVDWTRNTPYDGISVFSVEVYNVVDNHGNINTSPLFLIATEESFVNLTASRTDTFPLNKQIWTIESADDLGCYFDPQYPARIIAGNRAGKITVRLTHADNADCWIESEINVAGAALTDVDFSVAGNRLQAGGDPIPLLVEDDWQFYDIRWFIKEQDALGCQIDYDPDFGWLLWPGDYCGSITVVAYEAFIFGEPFDEAINPFTEAMVYIDPSDNLQIVIDKPELKADGKDVAQAILFPNDQFDTQAWKFVGNTLGCTLSVDQFTGMASITAGRICGTVVIQAYYPGVENWYVEQTVRIVAPDDVEDEDGDCNECPPGSGSIGNHSVEVRIDLGKYDFGKPLGFLYIKENLPSDALSTPAKLKLEAMAPSQEHLWPIMVAGELKQLKSVSGLVRIVVNSARSYQVELYKPSQTGAQNPDGTYAVSGQPFTTWLIQNPDQTGNNKLDVSEIRDGRTILHRYEYLPAETGWLLTQDGGKRKEKRVRTGNVETRTITDENDLVFYKEVKTYQSYAWGEELIGKVVGVEPNTMLTEWLFYTDSTDASNYKRIKEIRYPGGGWERFSYDEKGRKTRVVSQYADLATPTTTTEENQHRVRATEYYSGTTPSEMTTESINGTVVSKSYRVTMPYETWEILCQTTTAAWDAPANVVEKTWLYSSGAFQGELQKKKHANGVIELYTYSVSGDERTTVVKVGVPNGSDDDVVDGVRTLIVEDQVGNRRSTISYAIQPGVAEANQPVIASAVATAFESGGFGRPTTVALLGGRTETISYACCGVETRIDREGITTSYDYDDFKRLKLEDRAGVARLIEYTPDGKVKKITRRGSHGTTTPSDIVIQGNGYDAAGRLTRVTNALNQVTTIGYSYSSGSLTVTTTFPNNSTRIEAYYKDGRLKSVSGTAAHPLKYEYAATTLGEQTKEIRLVGTSEAEWTKTYTDSMGRPYRTEFPLNNAYSQRFFLDGSGQVWKVRDPDGGVTLYDYTTKGELWKTAIDLNGNNVIDDDVDRITQVLREVADHEGTVVTRTTTMQHETVDGNPTTITVSIIDEAVDGSATWSTVANQPVTTTITYPAAGLQQVVTTKPDLSTETTVLSSGRIISVTLKDSLNAQVGQKTFGYDPHGRLQTLTDARNGTTTTTYYDDDRVATVVEPAPGNGQASAQTTGITYNDVNAAGPVITTTLPDSAVRTEEYYLTGELKKRSGSRTLPVLFEYDSQGRRKKMRTWQNAAQSGGEAVTEWGYDARGFLTSVTDNSSKVRSYGLTDAGRLTLVTWARDVKRRYAYNSAGDLWKVDLGDNGSFEVVYGYDRRGNRNTVTDASGTRSATYPNHGSLATVEYSAGLLSGVKVERKFDELSRFGGLKLTRSSGVVFDRTQTYDEFSRLRTAGSTTYSAEYAYHPNSMLTDTIAMKSGAATVFTTKHLFDLHNKPSSVRSSRPGDVTLLQNGFGYNGANLKNRNTLEDNSYWSYDYDPLGQLKTAKRFWSENSYVGGQQFEYTFDDIGNRKTAKSGGDGSGQGLRTVTYNPNLLNRYTSRNRPDSFDVVGEALSGATVTVNNQAVSRSGSYFFTSIPVTGGSGALVQQAKVLGVIKGGAPGGQDIVAESTENFFFPEATEVFAHDDDGNLTQDGRWTYEWDEENRLVKMTDRWTFPGFPRRELRFAYDDQGRRIRKHVYRLDAGNSLESDIRFVYSGWLLIAELDGMNNNAVLREYLWASDLSGSLDGAGGIGGLKAMKTAAGTYFYVYDGMGNVRGLVDTSGNIVARYEYGPFGELIQATGYLAFGNPFRFSTKFTDDETGLSYYGYRYYQPSTGRWLTEDPFGVEGGLNLYGITGNDPVNSVDPIGLDGFTYNDPPNIVIRSEPIKVEIPWWEQQPDWLRRPLKLNPDIFSDLGKPIAAPIRRNLDVLRAPGRSPHTYNGLVNPALIGPQGELLAETTAAFYESAIPIPGITIARLGRCGTLAARKTAEFADDISTLKSIRRHTERLVQGKTTSSNPSTMLEVRDIQAAIANGNFRSAGTEFHSLNFQFARDAQARGFLKGLNIDRSISTPGGFLSSRRPDYLFQDGGIFDIKPFRSSRTAYDTTPQFIDIQSARGIMPVPLYYRLW